MLRSIVRLSAFKFTELMILTSSSMAEFVTVDAVEIDVILTVVLVAVVVTVRWEMGVKVFHFWVWRQYFYVVS